MPDQTIGCPICESSQGIEFLSRSATPVHQNMVLADRDTARALPRGRLAMHVCPDCGFVFNAAFDPGLIDYCPEYDNTQTCSPSFTGHVDSLVSAIVDRDDVRRNVIVEIGCGKGDFLRRLLAVSPNGCGIGYDPAYVGPESESAGRLRFVTSYFDEHTAPPAADLVISRHVIEHVSRPVEFLASIRKALRGSADTRVFLETPCVEWILRNQVVWDFFYEHCSLFTAQSLTRALGMAGFNVEAVRHVFGGQYLWVEARPGPAPKNEYSGATIVARARDYQITEKRWLGFCRAEVLRLRQEGPVAIWGAGAKGVTFCNLIDPNVELLAVVVDVNPAKQGHFIPGTGHPIIAPESLSHFGVRSALVLNPNYLPEISQYVSARRLDIQAIDLMNQSTAAQEAKAPSAEMVRNRGSS